LAGEELLAALAAAALVPRAGGQLVLAPLPATRAVFVSAMAALFAFLVFRGALLRLGIPGLSGVAAHDKYLHTVEWTKGWQNSVIKHYIIFF
jgi:hypothetical protein